MPKIFPYRQRSPQWFNWRKDKITASNVAAAMGLSPFESPLMLYNRLQSNEQVEPTPSMDRGTTLEPHARKWVENQLDMEFPESCAEDDEFPWLAASLDGYNEPQRIAIEIKCFGKKGHNEAKLGVVKPVYFPQIQAQLRVYNLDWMYYIAYDPEEGGEIIKVQRDDKFIEKMLPMLADFRQRLINFLPPDPTDKDLIDISSAEALCYADLIKSANDLIAFQEGVKENARQALMKISDGKSCKIGDYRFVKFYRKGSIQYDKIEELKFIDLEKYRKPNIEQWRFS